MVDRLRDLQSRTPDVEASAIVSVDGLIIASSLPAGVEEDRVSAMSAAMLSLGERIATGEGVAVPMVERRIHNIPTTSEVRLQQDWCRTRASVL